jgi:hypothetical protein
MTLTFATFKLAALRIACGIQQTRRATKWCAPSQNLNHTQTRTPLAQQNSYLATQRRLTSCVANAKIEIVDYH